MTLQHAAANKARQVDGIDPQVREAVAEVIDGGVFNAYSPGGISPEGIADIFEQKVRAGLARNYGHPEKATAIYRPEVSFEDRLVTSMANSHNAEEFAQQVATISGGKLNEAQAKELLHQLKTGHDEEVASGKFDLVGKTNEAMFTEGKATYEPAAKQLREIIGGGIDAAVAAPVQTPKAPEETVQQR